jgi:hypothetical protein
LHALLEPLIDDLAAHIAHTGLAAAKSVVCISVYVGPEDLVPFSSMAMLTLLAEL